MTRPLSEIREDIRNTTFEFLDTIYTTDSTTDAATTLMLKVQSFNLPFLTTVEGHVAKLWDTIREIPDAAETIILAGTSHIYINGINSEEEWRLFSDSLTRGWSMHHRNDSMIDQALLDRLPQKETTENIIENNPWIIFVYWFNEYIHRDR